jgi:ATP-dependent DNA helicase HFM1/MER3
VSFHHAGLGAEDRATIEKSYLAGQISVICCTSTLAVGINLPCHLIVIKNTRTWGEGGLKDYSDLEILQMLGRAGRPQFDVTGVAVILTRQENVERYQKLVSGQEKLESKLHLNLLEHLNAEIGLGTVTDLVTARKWLDSTFLVVRMLRNPQYYKLDNCTSTEIDASLQVIIERDVNLLLGAGLIIRNEGQLTITTNGELMAKFYVKFETMRRFAELKRKSSLSDVVSFRILISKPLYTYSL